MSDAIEMAGRLRGAADLLEREFAKARERGQCVPSEDERQVAELREAAERLDRSPSEGG